MKGLVRFILNLKHDYEWLFFKNEFNELTGEHFNHLLRLMAILLVTFLALSYAKGSYNYLNKKMNNPFTNWVTVPIETTEHKHKREPIKRFFDTDSNKINYGLSSLSGFSISEEFFFMKDDTSVIDQLGRTIDPKKESNLLKQILNQNNLIWSTNDFNTDAFKIDSQYYYDIIINTDFLKRLSYEGNEKLLKVKCQYKEDEIDIWLNIIAIVEQLPNNATFLCFSNLYNALDAESRITFIDEDKGNRFQVLSTELNKAKITNQLINALPIGKHIDAGSTEVKLFQTHSNQSLNLYTFFLDDKLVSYKTFGDQLRDAGLLNRNDVWHYIPFNKSPEPEFIKKPYYFAFNFDKLHFIRKFKNYLKTEYEIEVEMSQVEAKENFSFVSALTQTISLILFILGLATVIIYLINLLNTHLNSIKKNLGTYKAFGLSDNKLNTIYLKIVLVILSISTIFSFILIFMISKLGIIDWLLPKLIAGLDPNIKSISVFNHWNLIAVLLLFGLCIFLTYQTIKKILNKTPGDLIYKRS